MASSFSKDELRKEINGEWAIVGSDNEFFLISDSEK